ncbi:MAG: DUF4837 family protein [Bacteroidales bacterium]|nr:DUF4837 family protein [Bacteroidales bacterium]
MKKLLTGFSIIAVMGFFLIVGCKPETRKQQQQEQDGVMPSVTGRTGELVVVMDTNKFNGEIGVPIKKKLSAVFKGLPQPEPIFDLINIPHRAFDKGFRTHRNILRVNVADKYTEPRFIVRKNVYAKPQTLVEAQVPDYLSIKKLFENRGDDVAQRFIEGIWNRYIKLYKGMRNRGASQHLKEKFGISLVIPKGYKVEKDTSNFTWIAKDAPRYSQGFLVYKYPYSGERTFTLGFQIQIRDRFTKKFVPGPSPNSYMITETEVTTPYFEEKVVNNHKVHEMRGLWKVENDFMGGPFVSYSIFDENTGNVVNIDGFVYAPRFDKRDYVRQIEAILQTLELARESDG